MDGRDVSRLNFEVRNDVYFLLGRTGFRHPEQAAAHSGYAFAMLNFVAEVMDDAEIEASYWLGVLDGLAEHTDIVGVGKHKKVIRQLKKIAPGAQPAPSVPDLLESLRCACNYIDKLGGVSQQYRAMLAAVPEAKP